MKGIWGVILISALVSLLLLIFEYQVIIAGWH